MMQAIHQTARDIFNISIVRVDSLFESCETIDVNGTLLNSTMLFGADIILPTQNVTVYEAKTEYIFLYIMAGVVPALIACFCCLRKRYLRKIRIFRREAKHAKHKGNST